VSSGARNCPHDLLTPGRQLSQLERRAVDAHLAQCEDCRAADALAVLFETIPDSEPGDRALIARVAEREARPPARSSRPVPRVSLAWMAAGVAILCAATSLAAWFTGRRPEPAARPEVASDTPAHGAARAAPGAARSRSAPEPAPPLVPEAVAIPKEAVSLPARRRDGVRRATEGPAAASAAVAAPRGAASLFAEANSARRSGDAERAMALYDELQIQFGDTAEALQSRISLGTLLFELGKPARALEAFDAYAAHVPAGPLLEEALFGRARCLRLLDRQADERRTWEALVSRFPGSAYEAFARRRLHELGR
jgi:TolA-binding protein